MKTSDEFVIRPLDWQINKQNLGERGQYLLETGVWSDCTFIVGLPPTVRVSNSQFTNF